MLSNTENILVVVCGVLVSMAMMMAINRFWPVETRRDHNDVIGWHLSVVGTMYAVILGFMLYTVWTNFGTADLNADAEANALLNLYRISSGLPDPQRQQLRSLSRLYADVTVNQDWPQMWESQVPPGSGSVGARMWQTLLSVKATSSSETTAEDHALSQLSALTEHRRMRLLQSSSTLPGVLWCVLLLGGLVTIGTACTFVASNAPLHMVQIGAISFIIILVLVGIADIDRPFQGAVQVKSAAFQRVEETIDAGQ